jgi:hypothetical protein
MTKNSSMGASVSPKAGSADKGAYDFSTKWFESVRPIFKSLFSQVKPARVLEIGSFEGQALST